MKRLSILGILACVVMFIVPGSIVGAPPALPTIPVVVTNTPLPVTGNVNATVTGNVNVQNTPLPVTLNLARQPLYIHLYGLWLYDSPGNFSNYVSVWYTVPEGHRLVVEQVFLHMGVPTNTTGISGQIFVDTSIAGGRYCHYLPFLFTDQGLDHLGYKTLNASQSMKLYIQPKEGETKQISFWVTVYGGTHNSAFGTDPVLCGYLEKLP